jgi:hypothetical protein
MRNRVSVGAIALCMMFAQGAAAQECDRCAWSVIVRSATTTDLYPAGNSREACEQLAAQGRVAEPAGSDVEIECVDSTAVNAWVHDHILYGPPPSK